MCFVCVKRVGLFPALSLCSYILFHMITLKRDQTCNHSGSFGFIVSNGKKYIVPRWIEVPMDTDYKDVAVEEKAKSPRVKISPDKEWIFIGSKGNEYSVIRSGGGYSCTCPAAMFQKFKDCKHIVQAKAEEKK